MVRRMLLALSLSGLVVGCASGPAVQLGAASTGGAPSAADAKTPESPATAPMSVAGDSSEDVAAVTASGPWIGAAGATRAMLPGVRETSMGVWVDVPNAHREVHAPVALALVIDTSGSMAGEKILNARAAANRLVEGLEDGDIVSIQTFSDSARQLLPPVRLDGRARARVRGTIEELRPDGGTNLFDGLRLGENTAQSAPASHSVRRVVVISDGIANVGPSSPSVLGAVAAQGADRGVQVTAIGVGIDYDETTLNELAMRSSGRLYHLDEPREMAAILEKEINLLQATMATHAFVEIVPAPGVQILRVDGVRADRWQTGFRVPLGSMFAGQHRELLVRMRVDAPQEGSHPLASVRLHFRDPSEGSLDRVQEVVARYDVTRDSSLVASTAHPKTEAIMAMVGAGQVAVQAAQDVNHDRFDEADRNLAAAEQQLLASAKQVRAKKDKARIMLQVETLQRARRSASAAAKAPPAARPAAKRKGALKLNDAGMDMWGL